MNPLLDSNSAYFKCYVAEELVSGELIGYILFFNTLEDHNGGGVGSGHDDPVAVIEDLFVKPTFRGRGIATQLWRKVLKVSIVLQYKGSFVPQWMVSIYTVLWQSLLFPDSREQSQQQHLHTETFEE